MILYIVTIEDAICAFLDRDALRIRSTMAIGSKPQYPSLTPDEWRQRWNESPIMQRAYGKHLEGFTKILAAEAAKHYKDIDLSNPNDYATVLADLVARRQNN